MSIWKKDVTLDGLNRNRANTLVGLLDIQVTDIGDNNLIGTMPVCAKTHQPMGLLHGGASAVLAETLGSIAANLAADEGSYCVGLELNCNHIRSVRSGLVTGCATAVHVGRSTQVWDIRISDDKERLVCISRLTMAVKQLG